MFSGKTIKGIKILKGMTALSLLLAILSFFIILGLSVNMVEAKRGPPKEVEPVIYNGINYTASHEKMGYVEAFNNTTGKKLWEIKVYDVKIDPNMEADVQWIFITNLSIVNGKLIVINEAGVIYEIDMPDAPHVAFSPSSAVKVAFNSSQEFSVNVSDIDDDLILAPSTIQLYLENFGSSQEYVDNNVTLLKEGYILSFDSADQISIPDKDGNWSNVIRIANFSLYKNGEVVKKSNLTAGEFFYYNKTMDGREYTIIEFKVDGIFNWGEGYLVQLRSFHQYSNGTGGQEIPAEITGVPPSEEWNRTFRGKDGYEEKMSVQQTGDGGYFLARSYISADWSGTDIWLNRTDAAGNELWNKTLFEDNAQVYAIQQTADNGFAVAGNKRRYSYSDSIRNAWLLKIGPDGHEQWNRTFGRDYDDTVSFISQKRDGGYILAGFRGEIGQGIWLIRTDPNGNNLRDKTRGRTSYFYEMNSFQQTADGGFIMTGRANRDFYGYYDAKLIKLDPNGNEQWNKTFGGKYDDRAFSVRQTGDGGYILAGMTELYGHDAWLIKTDPNGSEQWNRTFYVAGGGSEALDVQQTQDGYILAGRRISSYGHDALLIKTDSNGNELWSKKFGGERDDEVSYVRQTGDGGYILAGSTTSYGAGSVNAWLVKVGGEAVEPTKIPTASPTRTSTVIPTEKAPGFEAFLAITILLAICVVWRKKR